MLQPKPSSVSSTHLPRSVAPSLLSGALQAVLVDDSGEFTFDGAITRTEAKAVWTWLGRDVAPDLMTSLESADAPLQALEVALPALLARARAAIKAAAPGSEAERRLKGQLGGAEIWERLPAILNAIKCFPLLEKAEAFGRATNAIQDDEALLAALQSMPRHDAGIAALLMMAALGQVASPARLVVSATRIAGEPTETALVRAGFAPLVDAVLAHAQNAIPPMLQAGAFADMDLTCRAIERFHRLMRGLDANVELARPSRSTAIVAALTKTVSDKLAPRLKEVVPDINMSLRRAREGADRLDSDSLLAALNGTYLLATVRDCRDSLALNEAFDETWTRSGQALEMHLTRNMDALRSAPGDRIIAGRLDMGIKMAEIRFGAEYADVLRRARHGIERHVGTTH